MRRTGSVSTMQLLAGMLDVSCTRIYCCMIYLPYRIVRDMIAINTDNDGEYCSTFNELPCNLDEVLFAWFSMPSAAMIGKLISSCDIIRFRFPCTVNFAFIERLQRIPDFDPSAYCAHYIRVS